MKVNIYTHLYKSRYKQTWTVLLGDFPKKNLSSNAPSLKILCTVQNYKMHIKYKSPCFADTNYANL